MLPLQLQLLLLMLLLLHPADCTFQAHASSPAQLTETPSSIEAFCVAAVSTMMLKRSVKLSPRWCCCCLFARVAETMPEALPDLDTLSLTIRL
jgi:hypothetical protein